MPYARVKNELPLIPGYSEGAIAYASDAAAAPLNECICYINPVQSGSGDPSPSNVRPITGHTELNLVHTGKNLFSPEKAVADSDNADTYISGDWLYFRTGGSPMSYYINSDKQLTISGTFKNETSTNNILRVRASYTDGTVADMINATLTDTNEHQLSGSSISGKVIRHVYVAYTNSAVCMCQNVQLEIGSSATAYEPYTGSTTTTDLCTTVYGGTLDVVSGVLTVDRRIIDLGDINYTYDSSYTRMYGILPNGKTLLARTMKMYCSCYLVIDDGRPVGDVPNNSCYNGNAGGNTYIYIKEDATTDPTTFKTNVTGQKLVYELATPITTQLTPEQLNSILGENNFYHDCNGDTKITYIRRLDS